MRYSLDDVCEFINGGAWSDKEYVDYGLPVLKVTNCKPKGFVLEDVNYLPRSSATKYAKHKLKKDDVVIATVGSHPNLVDSAAGRSCIINSFVEDFYLNQNAVCIRSKDTNVLDQGFLGYLAKYNLFQHYIQMRGKGAANQMRIAIGAIKSYVFDFPPIETQRIISGILSSYDKLIENNQKQITLLEEIVQRLYKEWFVDFHFHKYEETPIIDGIPEGWLLGVVSDIAGFKRGKTITKKQAVRGEIPVVAGGKEPAYWHNKANTGNPVITVSASGNAGFTRMYYQRVWASDCSYLDRDATEDLFYVYLHLKYRQDDLYSMKKGACQQHVNANEINALEILIPTRNVLQSFSDNVSPYFEKISLLEKQILFAIQARDQLLPKLMSGEITV